jgi:hypothetical protein
MSLINEALKRAKEAHQQAPVPPPDLPFRPVEPGQQRARRGLGLLLPVALALVALLALLLVWQWAQRGVSSGPSEAAARTARPVQAPPETPAKPAPVVAASAAPAPATPLQAPASVPAAVPAAVPVVEPAAGATNPPVADIQDSQATNAAPAVAPAPPKPAPLRLQTIFFDPKRPSAIVSGKSVLIGDKVGALRVAAIDQESVTLVGSGHTNVLSLAP